MGFLEDVFLGGDKRKKQKEEAAAEDESASSPIPNLSAVANSVIRRCSRILALPVKSLQQSFETEMPASIGPPTYARNLLEYCSYKALRVETHHHDHLSKREFSILTFDMMLAWETPDMETESLLKANASSFDEDDGSIFSSSARRMASQVDGKRTVGIESFSRIASVCPAIADPITVHNLFDALTSSSGGQLHFLIYEKYLKSLHKVLKLVKYTSGQAQRSSLNLGDGEIVLDIDGVMPTTAVLQHIGISAWPGRLTLSTHALYFEAFRVGSYDKAVKYDLSKGLKQVIKRELTGPWGVHIFDKAVMYKSSVTEPVHFEFPQFNGNSRRDYWFEIIHEILHAHKFIRKFDLEKFQSAEVLAKAVLGIFRYRSLKENFHIISSNFKSTLGFNLAEKLPKGDKILEALYAQLQSLQIRFHNDSALEGSYLAKPLPHTFPDSLYTLSSMGFLLLKKEDNPKERDFLASNTYAGRSNKLQLAVEDSLCYSSRVEAARATLDQVKVEDVDTNLAVIKELLYPIIEIAKLLKYLAAWEDPFKSQTFLLLILYLMYRGWVRYMLPCIFLSAAACIVWHRRHNNGKPMEAFMLTAPPSKNSIEQLLTLQEFISQLEMNIQKGAITLLKLRTLLFAAVPQTTNRVAVILVIVAAAFAFMPFKHLLLLILLEMYTREMPLRRKSSEKLIRRLKEWWFRVPAAPVQLIRPQEQKKSR